MINKAIIIGNLGGDPEIRYTQNGNAVCNFSVATTAKWLVEGLLPAAGLTVLTGTPKGGKSLLALELTASIATGRPAWEGAQTKKTGVLFLGLLDDEARIARRLRAMGFDDPNEDGMEQIRFYREAPRLDEGFVEWLDKQLRRHPGNELVVVDPTESLSAGNIARVLDALREAAERLDIAVLAVFQRHEAADHADVCLSLFREDRTRGRLRVSARDAAEQNIPMTFDKNTLRWSAA